MKKFNKSLKEGQWFEWEDEVSFLLRPFPFSQISNLADTTKLVMERFMYCVMDWKGFVDEEGNPFECNAANKEALFGLGGVPLLDFVSRKLEELDKQVLSPIKN
jgi:hypothetical protein